MAAIEQYIERIADKGLQEQIRLEVERLMKKKRFGLVYENHLPDNVVMPEVTIRRGTKVALRDQTPNDVYEVQSLTDTEAICIHLSTLEEKTLPLSDLVAVGQRGDVIYPYLKQMDSVQNAPDSDLWHALIEADNYHALQLLAYLYPGKFDCIYIDPPYNKPDSHDWKYNCDYVDGSDSYRHSKWLSMMEARLKIAKKLLNPDDSVLIVTIDELEYHHLGCLLEQLFPDARIQMVTSVVNPKGSRRDNEFSRCEEYIFIVFFGNAAISSVGKDMLRSDEKRMDGSIRLRALLRSAGNHGTRKDRPNLFYPLLFDEKNGHFVGHGEVLPIDANKREYVVPNGCIAMWPIGANGTELTWNLQPSTLMEKYHNHFLSFSKWDGEKRVGYYLSEGQERNFRKGKYDVIGTDEDGAYIIKLKGSEQNDIRPLTVWNEKSHSASDFGTTLLNGFFENRRFPFPKSLYAVHDVIRFFVANKPNALILDFFAGSGTTLHAVNLLNAEDGGRRRCVMVTNNEIGEPKENELRPLGIKPGDEEWERWGIARYVNWPRTKCSILGKDVNGQPIEGDYITSLTETKITDRRFTQIAFLPENPTKKQKKALCILINKQKEVKLPTMNEDVPFLVSDDDNCNASILFDLTKKDEWMEELEGNDHITNFYIVAARDADYKRVKEEVSEMMGQIEETIPVKMPMSDGFKSNAVFFKLGFLDKRSVARGKQLQELLPLLWMKAGAKGEYPTKVDGNYVIWPENHMALLKNEAYFRRFREELKNHPEVETVYIITDSQSAYLSMIEELKGKNTYQLYRDYLENFRINYATK